MCEELYTVGQQDKEQEPSMYVFEKIEGFMQRYAELLSEIEETNKTGKFFFSNNIVGEWGELIAYRALLKRYPEYEKKLRKKTASNPGYDLMIGKGGKPEERFQVKARWVDAPGSGHGSEEFGVIKEETMGDDPEKRVEKWIFVAFKKDLTCYTVWLLDLKKYPRKISFDPKSKICTSNETRIASYRKSKGGYVCYYDKDAFASAEKEEEKWMECIDEKVD